jgi:hypothetical protein
METLMSHKVLNRNEGYIYILANKYIPYLVKIGKSHNPDKRVKQLSQHAGVPGQFRIIFQNKVFNYHIVESELHIQFERVLKADGYGEKTKEFFVVPSAKYAIRHVTNIIRACKKAYKKKRKPHQSYLFEPKNTPEEHIWERDSEIWKVVWSKKLRPNLRKKIKTPIPGTYEAPLDPSWPSKWWEKKKKANK